MLIQIEELKPIKEITPQQFNVESINSIKKKYPKLRNMSKAPTFALTYLGSAYTLMNNSGFTLEEATQIEDNYHELYKESGEWIKTKLEECCDRGYAEVAFGLRIRTPLLSRSILNTSKTPNDASAEARSVGNAISGQSYGLLNNRAAIAFMEKVYNSPWKYDIHPIAFIHDAIYLLIKDNIECLKWVNDNLIEEMAWQELPELQHPQVKLEAELDVFYNGWHQDITLPNNIDAETIKETIIKGVAKYE